MYSDGLAQRIVPPLSELCTRAGCPVPRVVLRDDVVRAAAVRQRKGHLQLVLSRQFVDRVDNRQLRAIMAHEIAHITMHDLRWSKARAGVSMTVGTAAGVAALALSSGNGIVFPVYLAGFIISSMLIQVVLAFPNRRLERRADLEGARIAEDPAGLASALAVAHSFTEEARNRIYGPLPWRWLLSPLSWTLPTHPPMAQRIATLESIAPVRAI
ncbi:MAG TPA: M48 family metallopeptidase [Acidimicrobiales bacterium]|nr:M48 family metallopeptidase [Acidimicrobiales bacterium]